MEPINVLALVAAGLYVLGAYQGRAISEMIEDVIMDDDMELTPGAKFILVWLWPYAAVRALMEKSSD